MVAVLGLTEIQGSPVVKPPWAVASHCMGVRLLSREWTLRMLYTLSSLMPLSRRIWK